MSDRVIIVTGAAKGIGLACAQRLVEDGHRVVLTDMDTDAGYRAAEDLAAILAQGLGHGRKVSVRAQQDEGQRRIGHRKGSILG